jgi:flagellar hook-associated protein 3 FlgL
LADQTLVQVNTVLTRCKELAEQAATGTMSQNNREQVGYEIRELFGQLINLANTEYEGRHIFGGHQYDEPAFVSGLNLTTNDSTVADSSYSIEGSSKSTIVTQFLSNGTVGVDQLNYRFSDDGGRTWTTATLASGSSVLQLGNAQLTMEAGTAVQAVDPADGHSTDNGTWMWIRPAAIYQGDDEDDVVVQRMGNTNVNATTTGIFQEDIVVRIDNDTSMASNISYSYSLDNGANWTTGNTVSDASTPNGASLLIPGGFLVLSSGGGNSLSQGDQFVIRPRNAQLQFEIAKGEYVSVNNVGKDVFGGVYTDPSSSNAVAALDGTAENMFETVGRLVGYIETNNQDGIQQMLEDLDEASQHIMTAAANVGAKENRLDVADTILSSQELNQNERLSSVEDVDVAELMTKLAQQQLIYESVLKSSSMIMRMNMVNFI